LSARLRRGHLVAVTLAGAWRASPPSISAHALATITPMLLQSGAAPLAWWRLRHSAAGASAEAAPLRNAYERHSIEAHMHERDITAAVAALRSAGVEPVLAKGWAVARLYPALGLRPYGDADLFVRPDQRAIAEAALAVLPPAFTPVDLHPTIVDMPDRDFDGLYDRSCVVELGSMAVRILGMEDHLRFLCLHLLRHGARRPLWLCDIGVVLDALPADFDWDRFASGEQRRTDWAVATLGLASRLLGARLGHGPMADRARHVPTWLPAAVLRQWGNAYRPRSSRLMGSSLHRADWFLQGLHERWPNSIEATYWLDGPVDARFRLRYQVAVYLGRALSFAAGRPHAAH
jgi:hypothetical protein